MASDGVVQKMVESMTTLNRTASEWMKKFGAHACTDITGFSFIGHALEMAIASQVGMVIQSKDIPVFPEAIEYARLGLVPGGAHSNRDFFSCRVDAHPEVPALLMDLLYDPQTSGGLLISLSSNDAERLVEALKKEENIDSCIVGEVVEEPRGKIRLL
jgi:selenide,water dikinase